MGCFDRFEFMIVMDITIKVEFMTGNELMIES